MKTTELRIGNLIYNYDNPLPQKVDGLDEWKMQSEYLSEYSMPDKFTPIQLTEEWLLKAGFQDRSGTLKNKNSYGLDINSVFEICWYRSVPNEIRLQTKGSGATMVLPCNQVHQLQNLYFALTGNELIFND